MATDGRLDIEYAEVYDGLTTSIKEYIRLFNHFKRENQTYLSDKGIHDLSIHFNEKDYRMIRDNTSYLIKYKNKEDKEKIIDIKLNLYLDEDLESTSIFSDRLYIVFSSNILDYEIAIKMNAAVFELHSSKAYLINDAFFIGVIDEIVKYETNKC